MHERVNIEAERGRLQMTKGDMCKALGVTLKTYNAHIRGAAMPQERWAAKLLELGAIRIS